MSSLAILDASVFRYCAEKNTQTNSGENPTPTTTVSMDNLMTTSYLEA